MASSSRVIDLTEDSPELPPSFPASASAHDGGQDLVYTGSRASGDSDVSFLGVNRPGSVARPTPRGSGAGARSGAAVGEGSSRSFMGEHSFDESDCPALNTLDGPDDISEAARSGAFREASPPWTRNRGSAMTIHDSPPLRTRSNPGPAPAPGTRASSGGSRLGGGGLFRENQGNRFTGILAGFGAQVWNAAARDWGDASGSSPRHSGERFILGWTGPGRRGGGRNVPAPDVLGFDPYYAAVYPYVEDQEGHPAGADSGLASPNPYRVVDSHPHKSKPGFARDIIPSDREVLTLDPETQTLRVERENLRPVCASCERELCMGQDASSGRRPSILACGHVVDSQCLQAAVERAKSERSQARSARGRASRGGRGGRSRRSPAKTTQTGPVRNQAGRPQHSSAEPSSTAIDLSTSPVLGPASGGKGKAKADAPVPADTSNGPAAASRAAQTAAGKRRAEAVIQSWWTVCPVADCDGDDGSLLARKGTRSSPWEMFI